MAKKLYDVAAKVGSYVDQSGNEKNRYQNLGVILEGKYGPYLLLNRWVNVAGLPCDPDKDSVIVSLFPPRDFAGGGSPPPQSNTDDEVVF
jgi:hypothetical protein